MTAIKIEIRGSAQFVEAVVRRWDGFRVFLLPHLSSLTEVRMVEPHLLRFDVNVTPGPQEPVASLVLAPEAFAAETLEAVGRFAGAQAEAAQRAWPVCLAVVKRHAEQTSARLADMVEGIGERLQEAAQRIVPALLASLVRTLAWSDLSPEEHDKMAPLVRNGLDLDFLRQWGRRAPLALRAMVAADNLWRPQVLGQEPSSWFDGVCPAPVGVRLWLCFRDWARLVREPRREGVDPVAARLTQAIWAAAGSPVSPGDQGEAPLDWED
jgi:hypothetical protein